LSGEAIDGKVEEAHALDDEVDGVWGIRDLTRCTIRREERYPGA
jgi:hypothetical protein